MAKHPNMKLHELNQQEKNIMQQPIYKFVLEEDHCTENAYLAQDWQNKFKKKVQS